MITSLLVDNIEYSEYLLYDEKNLFKFQAETGINQPASATYEFSLLNTNNLENAFLKNDPFNPFVEGLVKLYVDGICRFKGFVDKENSKIYKGADKIDIFAVSYDKYISSKLSDFDITQLYYLKDGSIPVRQRGGRGAISVRHQFETHNTIKTLIETMVNDLEIPGLNLYTNLQDFWDVNLKYKYNEEKYGQILERRPIGKSRNNNGGIRANPFYNFFVQNKSDNDSTESYNSLLKEFCAFLNFVFFYEPSDNSFRMLSRYETAALGKPTVLLDRIILNENNDDVFIPIRYKQAYNGIIFEFDDVRLLVKITYESGEKIIHYGMDGIEYELRYEESTGNYFIYLGDHLTWTIGTTEFEIGLYIENAITIKMNAKLNDYLFEGFLAPTLGDYLSHLFSKHSGLLNVIGELELKILGAYFAPFKVQLLNKYYTVYYCETDFNTEETLIRLNIQYE